MWDYIFINIVLSLVVIVLAHYIWEHLVATHTIKKSKNLAEFESTKYKAMIDALTVSRVLPKDIDPVVEPDFLTPAEKEWMVKELSAYLASDQN